MSGQKWDYRHSDYSDYSDGITGTYVEAVFRVDLTTRTVELFVYSNTNSANSAKKTNSPNSNALVDGDNAKNGTLGKINGLACTTSNLFIAEGTGIRQVTAAGIYTTVVGNLTSDPYGLAMDANGDLIYGYGNDVEKVNLTDPTNPITTLFTREQSAWLSRFTLDGAGNVYFTALDSVYKWNATDGQITLIAGSGRYGFSGDGGDATKAKLNSPRGLAVDSEGTTLFIAGAFSVLDL
jgi:hypothetical protein